MKSKEFKLTKTKVDSIPYSESGQVFYLDSVLEGFGLRVGKTTKAYYAEKRVNGKTVRVTIGKHGLLTAEEARKKAQKSLVEMDDGKNLNDRKKQTRVDTITLKEAFDEFLDTRKSLKPRTIYDYKRIMEVCFHNWYRKPVNNINKDMVAKRHTKIGKENGEAYANLAMRILRAIFNFAMARYEDTEGNPMISENPVKRLSQTRAWYRVDRRITVIKSHELPAFFEGIDQLRDTAITTKAGVVRDYLLLLLFTGLRRQEAARLRWDQIDFKAKTLTVTDTKNNEPLTLPLSDYLHDLLQTRNETKENDFVFPGNSENGYIVEPRCQVKKVVKYMKEVSDNPNFKFTLHDLRRTFITIAESLDISAYALKRLLNHKMSGDVTAGYIIQDPERLRKPMQKITDYILSKAGVKPRAEIIKLESRRI